MSNSRDIPMTLLPKGWKIRVRSAMLHFISLRVHDTGRICIGQVVDCCQVSAIRGDRSKRTMAPRRPRAGYTDRKKGPGRAHGERRGMLQAGECGAWRYGTHRLLC